MKSHQKCSVIGALIGMQRQIQIFQNSYFSLKVKILSLAMNAVSYLPCSYRVIAHVSRTLCSKDARLIVVSVPFIPHVKASSSEKVDVRVSRSNILVFCGPNQQHCSFCRISVTHMLSIPTQHRITKL